MSLNIAVYNETMTEVDTTAIKSFATTVATKLFPEVVNGYVEISVVGSDKISELNKQYLGQEGSTDVISFPGANPDRGVALLGTVVYCPEVLTKYNETAEQVIEHGLLHLKGYDHETNKKEWDLALKELNHGI